MPALVELLWMSSGLLGEPGGAAAGEADVVGEASFECGEADGGVPSALAAAVRPRRGHSIHRA